MLIVQFLLGMAVNLFVKIPADHPGMAAYVALLYSTSAPPSVKAAGA
jgi:hypothetical protein